MRKYPGYTLLELLVVIAIFSLLLSVAVPSFSNSITSNQIDASANTALRVFQYARTEAIKRGKSVTITPENNDWNQPWRVVYEDDTHEQRLLTTESHGNIISIASTVSIFSFLSKGMLATESAGSLLFCDPNGVLPGRRLEVSIIGHASLTVIEDGDNACNA